LIWTFGAPPPPMIMGACAHAGRLWESEATAKAIALRRAGMFDPNRPLVRKSRNFMDLPPPFGGARRSKL